MDTVMQIRTDVLFHYIDVILVDKTPIEKLATLECVMIERPHYMHGYGELNPDECPTCKAVERALRVMAGAHEIAPYVDQLKHVHKSGWPKLLG